MKRLTRKIHLDFHTGPDVPNIGAKFDKKQFQDRLKKGKVQSIVLFAKCHNGYIYFPSKVGKMHPGLSFDLLGAQIEAAHEIGVTAPIYVPIGWSELDAMEHPEWCVDEFYSGKKMYYPCTDENHDMTRPFVHWSLLCPTGKYLEMLEKLTAEICERYAPVDGLFYDICFLERCTCPNCIADMKSAGLDPTCAEDVEKNFEISRLKMMERLSAVVKSYNKEASVFYNGSCTSINNPAYLPYQSHFEMEALPTIEGTFDVPDFYVRQLERYDKDIFGMTGRFEGNWGEFGTYKTKEALRCEIANYLSLGVGAIVGDHCHPSGLMDEAAYDNIGYAYEYMEKYEELSLDTKRVADIGVVRAKDHYNANLGVNSFLINNQLDYRIVDYPEDLEGIRLLILPDNAVLRGELLSAVSAYVNNGGKLLASGTSLTELNVGIKYLEGETLGDDYLLTNFDIGLGNSPCLMRRTAYHTDGIEAGFTPVAKVLRPYFARTYGHFSGHKNTPYNTEDYGYTAAWVKNNIVFLAHDVFSLYHEYGSPFLSNYVMKLLMDLYGERTVYAEGLSSVGRVRLRKNENKNYYALHLLYLVQRKNEKVFTLEDYPEFYNTRVILKLPESIKSATLLQTGEDLPIIREGDKAVINISHWQMHALVILKY